MKLKDELLRIARCFEDAKIDYAICGGLAVAVHGYPRFTKDIDFLILSEQLAQAKSELAKIEYDLESGLFYFNQGTSTENRMYRTSRAFGSDLVTIYLLLVAPVFQGVWADRELIELDGQTVKVVSKAGLIRMKKASGRPQDLADITALRNLGTP